MSTAPKLVWTRAAAVHAAVAAVAGEIRKGASPQTLTGREQRDCLENVGLARAVGSDEHDRLRAEREGQAVIIAEVRQRQPLDPEAGRPWSGSARMRYRPC